MMLLDRALRRVSLGRKVREYRGRQICADTDHHERAIARLLEYAPAESRVADVGCGYGAFSLRLVDAGFDVVGLDVVPEAEQATTEFAYAKVDLFDRAARAEFLAQHGRFDVVVLIEVIEHVHNPWETLAFVHEMLRDGGVLLLTTPNITSFFSRMRFLRRGWFHQFEPHDLDYGHVNPMTALMVETVLRETGFELLSKSAGSPMPVVVWEPEMPRVIQRVAYAMQWLVAVALIPMMRGGDLDGWSLMFVARRGTQPTLTTDN